MTRLLDWVAPESLYPEADARRRARVFAAISAIILCVGALRATVFFLAGVYPAVVAFILVSATGLIYGLSVRRRWNPRLFVHLFAAQIQTALFLTGVFRGGVGALVLMVNAILPLVVTFLLDVRSGTVWWLIGSSAILGLALGEGLGILVLPDQMAGNSLLTDTVTSLIIPAAAFSVAAVYEWSRVASNKAIEEATKEQVRLEVSRQLALAARATAEAETEAARAANASKSRFLASMSHDLRTPLTTVVGLSSWLQREDLSERHVEALRVLSSASETLLALIDDILDFSRAEAGMLELSSEPVDVGVVCEEVMSVFAGRAAEKGLSLTHRTKGSGEVLADPIRLRQILFNLVGNAIKYTRSGEVVLEATYGPRDEDEHWSIELVVRDTGVGIPEEARRRIFESFTQLQQHSEGSGLGLGIVTQIVHAMEGTVEVQSELGVGSTFIVRLVAPPAPHVEKPIVAHRVAELRILVAEDNPVNRKILEMMLKQFSCDVTSVSDGAEAVSLLTTGTSFDLVLMDCRMPILDGQAATRQIRSAGLDIPIVALTADATPEVRTACIDAGMNDFVTKPISQDHLEKVLSAWSPTPA